MKIDITREISFRTARSGGSGGQNVNKVETMVEGLWDIDKSQLIADEQKVLIKDKLRNRITQNGILINPKLIEPVHIDLIVNRFYYKVLKFSKLPFI